MNDRDGLADFDHPASSAEAMLAATVALMTGYAQVSTLEQRCLMAHKVCAALLQLADDPDLSVDFRMALSALHRHWQVLLAERLE
jgi:hypothetical protein